MKKCGWDDCFTCPYADCVVDEISSEEILQSYKQDKAISKREKTSYSRDNYYHEYYMKNREIILARMKNKREQNGEEVRERDRAYYHAHAEKRKAAVTEWRKKNAEKVREYNRQQWAKKKAQKNEQRAES